MEPLVPLHETNVFKADSMDEHLHQMVYGKWYYAEVSWVDFHGPFDTYEEANTKFQTYIAQVRMCPGCEE